MTKLLTLILIMFFFECKEKPNQALLVNNPTIQKEETQSNSLSIDHQNDIPKLHEPKVFLLEKGAYFINTMVESITTGENTHLKFNFFVENKKK